MHRGSCTRRNSKQPQTEKHTGVVVLGERWKEAGAGEAPSALPTLAGRMPSRDAVKLQFFHARRAV